MRAASRHPETGKSVFGEGPPGLEQIRADVDDDGSISATLADVFGVVNAVSLYTERPNRTFHAVHVDAAARLAKRSHDLGVARLVHVSGIGADANSSSRYIRSRGRGEDSVRAAFPIATIIRPAVLFGPDDSFLTPLSGLLRSFPVFPVFGLGQTVLQPAYVEDVAEAITRAFEASYPATVYELAGPMAYSYKSLLETISNHLNLRRVLLPVPFTVWQILASCAELLPQPPITRNQVELMRSDNVPSPGSSGFRELGIDPRGIEVMLAGSSFST
ncbi:MULTISPECIES: complex I NDUFA9 subunit family protein [unclassified Bradyrhizobium]|uniref:complex I NDUFA9 subunit family protein n=1 Tax=unclassified Bradyrhizobium TaxID=2631580 RepID=UPI0024784755|nr:MULTISPECIES: complex I NDUFA9 subunit family protein [unclassified Bradyrhizobium]WGR70437.1 complex I NDUFA9 subunit family protein [Bradyrhizobium sp. ISRA426]WGR82493.1 complex I NDUFA9 subunit family protein [Bradyrhizobium sp. ISRA430]WGR85679.1 complex I NDUFA9 subunit family protein [Bradyrhizobium sp. ISRA432]